MVVITNKNFLGLEVYQPEDDEPYMSLEQKKHFQKLLQIWYRLLVTEMDDFKVNLQKGELCLDDVDRASYEESQRMGFRASERRLKLQKKVKKAMEKVFTDAYGYCKACGDEIGLERLEARPTADQCISCKTVAELYEQRSLE